MSTIRIQSEVFDTGAELRALRETRRDIGAVVCFEGVCRDSHPEQGAASADVQATELEHYPGMTEKSIAAMVTEAQSRWSLLGVTVIHRVDRLLPGDPIVSRHPHGRPRQTQHSTHPGANLGGAQCHPDAQGLHSRLRVGDANRRWAVRGRAGARHRRLQDAVFQHLDAGGCGPAA
uniref:Molybdopterin synthase catalytic subunit n=1 Tax=mine drainage metagenome TaxID=410659 RepID=E6PNF6_9ZZZZ